MSMSIQPLILLTRRAACSSTPSLRSFSTSPNLLNKASRARITRPALKPAQPSAIPDSLRGTGAGADPRVYGPSDTVVGRDPVPEPTPVAEEPVAQHNAPAEALGGQTQLETDAGTSPDS